MRHMFLMVLLPVLMGWCQEAPKKTAVPKAAPSYLLVNAGEDARDIFLKEVAAFLAANEHFYLATRESDGARVRPLKATVIIDNKLMFVTSDQKGLFAQLEKYPEVEIARTAIDGSAYLRYKGRAVVEKDAKVKAKLLELYPFFKKKFGEHLAVVAIEPEMVGIFPMKGGQAKTKVFTR